MFEDYANKIRQWLKGFEFIERRNIETAIIYNKDNW